MDYQFAQGTRDDLPRYYELLRERIAWMDEQGIQQWNTTDYWAVYPESHYEELTDRGELFVLRREGILVAGAALYESDPRWPEENPPPAFYVHHLLTDMRVRGAGAAMLHCCEDLARQQGKVYLRLDCAIDNERLNHYYENLAYRPAGTCVDGAYTGRLRQKLL